MVQSFRQRKLAHPSSHANIKCRSAVSRISFRSTENWKASEGLKSASRPNNVFRTVGMTKTHARAQTNPSRCSFAAAINIHYHVCIEDAGEQQERRSSTSTSSIHRREDRARDQLLFARCLKVLRRRTGPREKHGKGCQRSGVVETDSGTCARARVDGR